LISQDYAFLYLLDMKSPAGGVNVRVGFF